MVTRGIYVDKTEHIICSGGETALQLEVFALLMANILEMDTSYRKGSVHFPSVYQSLPNGQFHRVNNKRLGPGV